MGPCFTSEGPDDQPSLTDPSGFPQRVLPRLRRRPGSGGPAAELPTRQGRSEHPHPPRHLLPLRPADSVHPRQPLQRDPLAVGLQQRKTEAADLSDRRERWVSAVHLCVCVCVQDVDLYHERTRYFGVSELLESANSGSSLPLMRYDSSFENMASALEER